MGAVAPPTVSRPDPEIIANSLRIFLGEGGGGGKDNLHENICQKLHPDRLKMQQKAFGGRASPGTTGGAAPPDSLAAMRPTCKGERREEKEGEGKER